MKYEWDPAPLNALIEASGMTFEAVAKNSGVAVASLYLYHRGESSPSIPNLCAIADYFAVPIDYLIGRFTKEQADAILEDYAAHFMELRRAPWEAYLKARRGIPKQYIGYEYEAPWPYNLLDALVRCELPGVGKREEDFWENILTDSQALGLEQAIATLSPREQDAIKAYYRDGLNLDQIGKRFDVTRERVRQILAKAVYKLRHPSRFNLVQYGAGYKAQLQYEIDALQKQRDDLANQVKNLETKADRTAVVTLDEMDLSWRSWNQLKRAGVNTLPELVEKMKTGELIRIRNIGQKSIQELLGKVKTFTGEDYSDVYGF